jgi:hypothetical protein
MSTLLSKSTLIPDEPHLFIKPGTLVEVFPGMLETTLATAKFVWLGQFPPRHDIF